VIGCRLLGQVTRFTEEPVSVINPKLVTTAFELPGYRTVETLGVVRGIVVRSRSIVGNIGAALRQSLAATSRSTPSSARRLVPTPFI
jgi:Putative heavy-metal-binding